MGKKIEGFEPGEPELSGYTGSIEPSKKLEVTDLQKKEKEQKEEAARRQVARP